VRFTGQGTWDSSIKTQSFTNQNVEEINHKKAQDQSFNHESINTEISKGRWLGKKLSFAHHPRTEKKGIRIYRSINTEVTTVDSAPGRLLRHGLMT
jgi:hypothetical protein